MLSNEEGTTYIVSDGGVYNYEGTYGLVISNGDTIVAQNNGKMYSVDFYESSYRSELYAMLAGLLTFKAINDEYGMHQEKIKNIQLISDNNKRLVQKVCKRMINKRTINQHCDSDVDIELQSLHKINKLESQQVSVTVRWVKSHQELRKSKSALSHIETLNISADNLSTEARKHPRITKYTTLEQDPIKFTLHNLIINSTYVLRTKKAFNSIHLRQYLQDKHSWSKCHY
jgi:ribonuclease HI